MPGFLKWVGVIGLLLAIGLWWIKTHPPNPIPPPTAITKLVIEVSGGFAYVPTPAQNKLEIAYFNDISLQEDSDNDGDVDANDAVVCDVDQIGTELMVLRGDIIDSDPKPAPADRVFNLDAAVVEFPKLNGATSPVSFSRTPWPANPIKPANPGVEGDWQDLQFVPSIKDHHPGKTIMPTWRDEKFVNGRVVLKGGKIVGTFPSDPMVQKTNIEFKLAGTSLGSVGLTDKTVYSVDVPDDKIEIVFTGSKYGFRRVVIAPQGNQPVRLRLRGLHAMGSAATLANGDELKDFCSFYALLQPRPKSADWLRLHYIAPASTMASNSGQPSPGFFCGGDWF